VRTRSNVQAALSLTAALLMATACGGGTPGRAAPPATPSSVPTVSPSDPLAGTWSTGPHTCRQWHAAALRAGATEDQWKKFLRVSQQEVLSSVGSRPKCPPAGERAATFGHILQFQNALVSVTDRNTGAEDVVGFNGTYRILSDETFVMSDSTDRITVTFRVEGRELTLNVIEVNGRRPFHWPECACFELTLGTFPFFRVG
jgi:hypothetical protein